MTNYLNLLKTDFLNSYTFINKKQGVGKIVISIVVGVILFAVMVILGINIGAISVLLEEMQMLGLLFVMLAIASTALVLLTGIRIMSSGLFDSNDHELLSSLPIKPRTILMSKLTRVYIDSNTMSFILIFPSIIGIGLFNKLPISYYILTFITFMLVPTISIVISAVISIFMLKLFNRFNFMKKVFNLLYVLVYVAIFIPYFSFSMSPQMNNTEINMEAIASLRESLANSLRFYPFSGLIEKITLNRDVVSFIVFAAINIILLVLFAIIFEKSYKDISLKLKDNKASHSDKIGKVKQESVVFSLIKKDIINFSEYNVIVMQSLMGGLIASIMTYTFGNSEIINTSIPAEYINLVGLAFIAFISYFLCIAPYTAYGISMEGKNFWNLKSLPLKVMDVFISKIIISISISILFSIISLAILNLKFNFSFGVLILYFIFLTFCAMVSSVAALYFNLLLPNLKWDNINKAIKNSGGVIATIAFTFVHLIVCVLLGVVIMFISKFNFPIVFLSVLSLEVVLLTLGIILLNTHGKKLYEKIEV